MRKFAYVIIVAAITSVSLLGCAEQQVKPKFTGGQVSDPTGIK
jgi:hypothetical protein